ncbi:MAG: hypothetical protein ABIZ81_05715, partial [Opitutaceae bacterium]
MNATCHADQHHRSPRHRVVGWFALVALTCMWPFVGKAQPERFSSVKAWRGTFIAKAHRYTSDAIAPGGQKLGSLVVSYDSYFTADFLLDEFEDDPAIWRGRILKASLDADYRGVKNQVIDQEDGNTLYQEEFFNTSGRPDFGVQPVVELLFHRERGWSLNMSTPRRDAELTEKMVLTTKKGPMLREQTQRIISASAETGTETRAYPARGLILFAGAEKSEGARSIPGEIAGDIVWEYTAYLEPAAMEELRLEIDEPTDYPIWRPSTTATAKAGKPLVVTAKVVSVTGGNPQTRVERFIWELQGTSREPGVTLNFPVDATDDRLDLELDADGAFFVLKDKKQTMERAVQAGWADTVKVVPYDWGGWSTLQVTAVLVDGRRVTGTVKGKGDRGLRIPKRTPDSHIADGWKAEHEGGADNLDDDKIAGQKHDGDGFSLYEEYRGWIVAGQHAGGDPQKKDFFILDMTGGAAAKGIELFKALSQLTVHSELKPAEMSTATRLMNGNHRRGARQVDQHGVVISHEGNGPGGYNVGIEGADKSKAGRPKEVQWVFVEQHHENGLFAAKSSAEYHLSESDTARVYDRGVAHELLHSVGVDHHGEQKWTLLRAAFQGASAPLNPTGRARFTTGFSLHTSQIDKRDDFKESRGETITLLWEDTKADVAAESVAAHQSELAKVLARNRSAEGVAQYTEIAAKMAKLGITKDAAFWTEYDADRLASMDATRGIRVGHAGGTDSGDEECVMRYYFADAYKIPGRENAYYLIRPVPGSTHAGLGICRSPDGTGTNGEPYFRFGAAAGGRGNCFGDICPND